MTTRNWRPVDHSEPLKTLADSVLRIRSDFQRAVAGINEDYAPAGRAKRIAVLSREALGRVPAAYRNLRTAAEGELASAINAVQEALAAVLPPPSSERAIYALAVIARLGPQGIARLVERAANFAFTEVDAAHAKWVAAAPPEASGLTAEQHGAIRTALTPSEVEAQMRAAAAVSYTDQLAADVAKSIGGAAGLSQHTIAQMVGEPLSVALGVAPVAAAPPTEVHDAQPETVAA